MIKHFHMSISFNLSSALVLIGAMVKRKGAADEEEEISLTISPKPKAHDQFPFSLLFCLEYEEIDGDRVIDRSCE